MGGIIFIIPVIVSLILLYIKGSIAISYNLIIIVFVFLAYGLLGFIDDYLKVKFHNNNGISLVTKFLIQMCIALVFFYLFMKGGGKPVLSISFLNIYIDLGWMFGLFILFLLVGTTNAVNITDGLDGLAGGLSAIAFFAYGVISWNAGWLEGYQEIAIFCFLLVGALIGFLVFNTHPARIFMGDLGSLALGGALASVAIVSRHEISLAIIGGVFVIETLSSLIQIISIRYFNKILSYFGKTAQAKSNLPKNFNICREYSRCQYNCCISTLLCNHMYSKIAIEKTNIHVFQTGKTNRPVL